MTGSTWTSQNPTAAQMAAQYNQIVVGRELDQYEGADYLWGSGLNAGEFESVLVWKYRNNMGRYFMHTFLTWFDERKKPVASQDHEWGEFGFEHQALEVDTITGGVGTALLEIDIVNAGSSVFSRPWETYQGTNMVAVYVDDATAPVIAGGKEHLFLRKVDGTNFAAADVAVGDFLGTHSLQMGEATDQPTGKRYRPEPKSNQLSIVKETCEHSGDAMTQRSIIDSGDGSQSWITTNQDIALRNFLRMLENNLQSSQESAAGAAVVRNRGFVWDIIQNASVNPTYAVTLTEADLLGLMDAFHYLTDNTLFTGLAGRDYYTSATAALAHWVHDGNFSYGSFSQDEFTAIGLNVKSYSYAGKTLLFHNYTPFDDARTYPTTASPSATDYSMRDFAMYLNMSSETAGTTMGGGSTGIPYLTYVYKKLGVDRSLVAGYLKGMTGNQSSLFNSGSLAFNPDGTMGSAMANNVASPTDADLFYFLSQAGSRLLCVDVAHGFQRRTA